MGGPAARGRRPGSGRRTRSAGRARRAPAGPWGGTRCGSRSRGSGPSGPSTNASASVHAARAGVRREEEARATGAGRRAAGPQTTPATPRTTASGVAGPTRGSTQPASGANGRTGCRLACTCQWFSGGTTTAAPIRSERHDQPAPRGALGAGGGWHPVRLGAPRVPGPARAGRRQAFRNPIRPGTAPRAPSVDDMDRDPSATSCCRAATRRARCPRCSPRCRPASAVIVVDNGSRDGTADVARRARRRVRARAPARVRRRGARRRRGRDGGVRRGDGRRRLLRPRRAAAAAARRSRAGDADLALGRRRPVAAGVWPWHARAGNARRRAPGCAVRPASRCTTSRRCGSAAAPDLLASTSGTGASATRSSCCAGRPLAGWRLAEHDVAYRPRAAGTARRSAASVRGTIAHRPRLLEGAAWAGA